MRGQGGTSVSEFIRKNVDLLSISRDRGALRGSGGLGGARESRWKVTAGLGMQPPSDTPPETHHLLGKHGGDVRRSDPRPTAPKCRLLVSRGGSGGRRAMTRSAAAAAKEQEEEEAFNSRGPEGL